MINFEMTIQDAVDILKDELEGKKIEMYYSREVMSHEYDISKIEFVEVNDTIYFSEKKRGLQVTAFSADANEITDIKKEINAGQTEYNILYRDGSFSVIRIK